MTEQHHFFVSCIMGWIARDDLQDAINDMNRAYPGAVITVFKVPGPVTQSYGINQYAPQLEGSEMLVTTTLTMASQ